MLILQRHSQFNYYINTSAIEKQVIDQLCENKTKEEGNRWIHLLTIKNKMSGKQNRNRNIQRRFHANKNNNRQRPDKRPNRNSPEQVLKIKDYFFL